MQSITLIAMGKPAKIYAPALAEFEKRLAPMCKLSAVEIAEEPLDEKRASLATIAAALEKEGGRMLAALPKRALVCALCVEGKPLTSEAFADSLSAAALAGRSEAAFLIGSSHGLAPAVKQAADVKLSLSAMTLPHGMARLFLTEQIYRALSIRAGTKYHK